MKSSVKKLSITLPSELEKALKKRAFKEHRTMSGVLQESARFYLKARQWEELQQELSLKGRALGIRDEEAVDRLVHETRQNGSA